MLFTPSFKVHIQPRFARTRLRQTIHLVKSKKIAKWKNQLRTLEKNFFLISTQIPLQCQLGNDPKQTEHSPINDLLICTTAIEFQSS